MSPRKNLSGAAWKSTSQSLSRGSAGRLSQRVLFAFLRRLSMLGIKAASTPGRPRAKCSRMTRAIFPSALPGLGLGPAARRKPPPLPWAIAPQPSLCRRQHSRVALFGVFFLQSNGPRRRRTTEAVGDEQRRGHAGVGRPLRAGREIPQPRPSPWRGARRRRRAAEKGAGGPRPSGRAEGPGRYCLFRSGRRPATPGGLVGNPVTPAPPAGGRGGGHSAPRLFCWAVGTFRLALWPAA